ncbi:MAG: DUF2520 domain-containing protein [Alcanivoracaceae bacterium]|nr:DUF2520 domain-containing protein [Alcanivoracaceae bacterium]
MNRQVPEKTYTIVGDGKVARHFAFYFQQLGVQFNSWTRKNSIPALQQKIADADFILLLISDDAIDYFIKNNSCLRNKILIHFSGTLSLDNAIGCHPLMTFANNLYDLNTYQSIPFVCDDGVDFSYLFPRLTNQSFNITKADKAYYHALCVMAGNFTQTLMRETSNQLNHELKLPDTILFPYLLQNTKNFINNPDNSATGPIQRNDFTTVRNNLQALQGNPLEEIYKSFFKLANTPFPCKQESSQQCPNPNIKIENFTDSCLRSNDGDFFEEAVQ